MSWKSFFVICLIFFIFTNPFYKRGYFTTQDGEWAIVRLAEMQREIFDFQLPPRWADYLNHGYGYPLFLFTYPLPYYAGFLLRVLGFSLISSIKAVFVLSTFVSVLAMYFWAKRYWGEFGAVVSAVLYIMVPYRLVDFYFRGSIGEIVSMAVFPLVLWSLDNFIYKEYKNSSISAFFFALLILSHNASALFFTFFLVFYLIFKSNLKFTKIINLVRPFIQGLLLSAFFWLPAFFERKYVYLGHFSLADKFLHFADIADLITYKDNGIKPSLYLGIVHLIVFFLTFFMLTVKLKKKKLSLKPLLVLNLLTVFFLIFLLFPFSSFLWKFPFLKSVDFPWRVLVLVSFCLSFLSGSLVLLPKGRWIGIFLIIMSFIFYYPLVKTQKQIFKDDSYYETNDATTTSVDELMPIWVLKKPKDRPLYKIETKGKAEVSNLFYDSSKVEFLVNVFADKAEIWVNTLYFPGWKFWINGQEIAIYPVEKTGVIGFNLPKGEYWVRGKFTRTPIRLFADMLTVLGFLSIILSTKKIFLNRVK